MMSISSCCSNAGRSKYSSLLPRVRRAITRPCVRQLKSRPAIFPLLMLRFSHTASSAPADCIQIQTSFMEYGLQPQGFPVPKPASKHQGQPDQLPKNEDMAPHSFAMSRRRGLISEVRRTVPIYSTWAVISSATFGCSSEEALASAYFDGKIHDTIKAGTSPEKQLKAADGMIVC